MFNARKLTPLLCSMTMIINLYAVPYNDKYTLGTLFETNNSTILPHKILDYTPEIIHPKQPYHEVFTRVDSFQKLFELLRIDAAYLLTNDRYINSLLDNPYINDYTTTYLLQINVNPYSVHAKLKFPLKENLSFVSSIDYGKSYIILIHVQSKSQLEQTYLEKKLKHITQIDKYLALLREIPTENITIKSYPIPQLNSITIDTIEAIKSLRNDLQNNMNYDQPYWMNFNRQVSDIHSSNYFELLYTQNNINYIMKHPNQFKDINSTSLYQSKLKIDKKITTYIRTHDQQFIKDNIKPLLPLRFSGFIPNEPINLPTIDHLTSNNELVKRLSKIDPTKRLKTTYTLKIENDTSGQFIKLHWERRVYLDGELIQNSKNVKILFDTFTSQKNTKISAIKSETYGFIEWTTQFDKFSKNEKVLGNGMVESADCSYHNSDLNGTIDLECKNIKLKPIDIKFNHI